MLGRKRGYSSILATQRISTLNKTAAGECNNKFIGRMTLDVDIKRAAFELGVSSSEAVKMLRDRDAGQFYGFGPAIERTGVTLLKVGKVETTHPTAGKGRTLTPPKPSKTPKPKHTKSSTPPPPPPTTPATPSAPVTTPSAPTSPTNTPCGIGTCPTSTAPAAGGGGGGAGGGPGAGATGRRTVGH